MAWSASTLSVGELGWLMAATGKDGPLIGENATCAVPWIGLKSGDTIGDRPGAAPWRSLDRGGSAAARAPAGSIASIVVRCLRVERNGATRPTQGSRR